MNKYSAFIVVFRSYLYSKERMWRAIMWTLEYTGRYLVSMETASFICVNLFYLNQVFRIILLLKQNKNWFV